MIFVTGLRSTIALDRLAGMGKMGRYRHSCATLVSGRLMSCAHQVQVRRDQTGDCEIVTLTMRPPSCETLAGGGRTWNCGLSCAGNTPFSVPSLP